ncbi:uncharacterized protein LOC112555164 isoform X2 [Pomacea canaliculata]|uniref:uncharacterized protein LOC112555164 isoform X2 n=1 Tax=Pomacea canaliculata TaxID=400727 RepID=UPI000D7376DE|nr:uncharacterized protein LOC112555164 isoform X2 [Pomacea canaliculata]
MRLTLLTTIVLSFFCQGVNSFEWISDLQDGADIYACVDDTVTMSWRYAVQEGEVVEDVKWYFDPGNNSRTAIAAVVENLFFPLSSSYSNRLYYAPEEGITLTLVTGRDSGQYSVAVTVLNSSYFATHMRTVSLVVAEEVLVDHSKALKAQQERLTVHDNKTGQLHVQLSCGDYIFTGHPPVSVEWTFPSGDTQLVSTHIDGKFFLTLPNPVEGGNYTCRLWSKLPPVSCLPHNASVLEVSSVTVDEVKVRLSLLEGEQEMLKTDKQEMMTEMDRLREENQNLTEIINSQQRYFLELGSKNVMFDGRLSQGSLYVNFGQRVVFSQARRNEGNAYNTATGVFTAPFNGTYFFVLTAAHTYNDYGSSLSATLSLTDNGSTFCQVQTKTANVAVNCVATVYRTQGEQVWVSSPETFTLYGSYCSFVGVSLHSGLP